MHYFTGGGSKTKKDDSPETRIRKNAARTKRKKTLSAEKKKRAALEKQVREDATKERDALAAQIEANTKLLANLDAARAAMGDVQEGKQAAKSPDVRSGIKEVPARLKKTKVELPKKAPKQEAARPRTPMGVAQYSSSASGSSGPSGPRNEEKKQLEGEVNNDPMRNSLLALLRVGGVKGPDGKRHANVILSMGMSAYAALAATMNVLPQVADALWAGLTRSPKQKTEKKKDEGKHDTPKQDSSETPERRKLKFRTPENAAARAETPSDRTLAFEDMSESERNMFVANKELRDLGHDIMDEVPSPAYPTPVRGRNRLPENVLNTPQDVPLAIRGTPVGGGGDDDDEGDEGDEGDDSSDDEVVDDVADERPDNEDPDDGDDDFDPVAALATGGLGAGAVAGAALNATRQATAALNGRSRVRSNQKQRQRENNVELIVDPASGTPMAKPQSTPLLNKITEQTNKRAAAAAAVGANFTAVPGEGGGGNITPEPDNEEEEKLEDGEENAFDDEGEPAGVPPADPMLPPPVDQRQQYSGEGYKDPIGPPDGGGGGGGGNAAREGRGQYMNAGGGVIDTRYESTADGDVFLQGQKKVSVARAVLRSQFENATPADVVPTEDETLQDDFLFETWSYIPDVNSDGLGASNLLKRLNRQQEIIRFGPNDLPQPGNFDVGVHHDMPHKPLMTSSSYTADFPKYAVGATIDHFVGQPRKSISVAKEAVLQSKVSMFNDAKPVMSTKAIAEARGQRTNFLSIYGAPRKRKDFIDRPAFPRPYKRRAVPNMLLGLHLPRTHPGI
jgi:hypothetical protein